MENYKKKAPVRGTTVGHVVENRLNHSPDDEFFHCGPTAERWRSLRELDDRARLLAGGLADLGVRRGDRVASLLPNCIEVVELLFAAIKIGAIVVPLNYWLKGDLLRFQLTDCGAKVLVADSLGINAIADEISQLCIKQIVRVGDDSHTDGYAVCYESLLGGERWNQQGNADPGQIVSIIYTSGTTGDPKGCMLSSGYYVSVGASYGARGWVVPGDRVYTSFPLFHASGQIVALMSALANDAALAVAPEFHASTFMAEAAALRATTLIGVGTTANAILAQPPSPSDGEHRMRLSCWVPLAESRQREFEERFAVPVMAEGFGQTECVPISVSDVEGPRRRSTAGQVAPLVDVRIAGADQVTLDPGEVGEILVRPRVRDAMFSGYWNHADGTDLKGEDAWHHTGDVGKLDSDGFLHFVDRKKNVIRRRGENVSSAYLETTLTELDGVADVAICAVPAKLGDDDVKAYIVETQRDCLSAAAIFDFLRTRVAYFAIPRYVEIVHSLPTNALGRVLKHRLSECTPYRSWDLEELGLVVPHAERRGTAPSTAGVRL